MTSLFLVLAVLASQSGGEDAGSELVGLHQYRWHNRLIVIFAPSPDDPRYLEQHGSFNRVKESDMAGRDLLVFSCFPFSGILESYAQEPERQTFGARAADDLRKTFGVKLDEFQVVLVGKDGGEKRRSGVFLAAEELLEQIDSMPMRQREIREQTD